MEQTETTTTAATRTLVKDLDEQARIAYLASFVGKRVRAGQQAVFLPGALRIEHHVPGQWRHLAIGLPQAVVVDADSREER